jgi:hypothetical protein
VADAVGDPSHLDFVGAGFGELDVFHHDRLLRVVQNRRRHTHGALPLRENLAGSLRERRRLRKVFALCDRLAYCGFAER